MDSHQLRAVLLRIHERLSDSDRQRLHFLFGNDVPRQIRDNVSNDGTLRLIESLFDQNKISDHDFTCLIEALDEIQCHSAAQLLREHHMRRMQSNNVHRESEDLSTIMSTTVEEIIRDEQEDKFNTQRHLTNRERFSKNKNTTTSPRQSLPEKSSMTQNCLLLSNLVLITALAILIGFYVQKVSLISQLKNDLKVKDMKILEEQTQNNQIFERFNDRFKEMEDEKSNSLIKAGVRFGGRDGFPFDDSLTPNFTCSYYLRGIITRHDIIPLNWVQFLYSSPHDPDNVIEANLQGFRPKTDIEERFFLEKDEKISKIQVKVANVSLYVKNILQPTPLIRAIQFFTTKRRISQSIDHVEGEVFTEQLDGYTVGYVTGRSGLYIDQLQFHWYRTITEY